MRISVLTRSAASIALALLVATVGSAAAATINVNPGESIQAAIAAAFPGDTVQVAAGTYVEDLDFLGKDLSVVGSGFDTVVQGTGTTSVVTFASGEGSGATLESVRITGGSAQLGGGIHIVDSSPTIARNLIIDNRADFRGSGIWIDGAISTPLIANNLVVFNSRVGSGDPHGIQTNGSSPTIINNTVSSGDSNGLFLSNGGTPIVMNNILTRNGTRGGATIERRGRGICQFTPSQVHYNLFHRNAKSAFLYLGEDFRRIRRAQRFFESPMMTGNTDGNPKFARRRLAKVVSAVDPADFLLRSNSRAIGAGDPDPAFNNLDGTRNTAGHTGGPLAVP